MLIKCKFNNLLKAVGKFDEESLELLNNIACTFKGVFQSFSDNDDLKT